MTKTQYITKILELKSDYVVSRLFDQPLSELKKIYKALKTGLDPCQLKPSYEKKQFPKRQVDELGRVAIPKQFRKLLGIKLGDVVEFKKYGDGIIIRKVEE